MPDVQKKWVGFKQFFRTSHHELRETRDFAIQDAGMHHASMVLDVVAGIQEVLQKYPVPVQAPTFIQDT